MVYGTAIGEWNLAFGAREEHHLSDHQAKKQPTNHMISERGATGNERAWAWRSAPAPSRAPRRETRSAGCGVASRSWSGAGAGRCHTLAPVRRSVYGVLH
jgi:hypothetical protein